MPPLMEAMGRVKLDAAGLSLARGERLLFSGLSFQLSPGDALRITGNNGSGKTSLLRVLCGLTRPDAGAVARGGPLLYVGHAEGVKHELLAWENLAYGPLLGAPEARQQALQALAAAGLAQQAMLPCRALSQGQRKRVALARLQLAAPDSLWILDEPFSALDSDSAAALTALLTLHCRRGGIVVYTTHQDQLLAGAATLELDAGAGHRC